MVKSRLAIIKERKRESIIVIGLCLAVCLGVVFMLQSTPSTINAENDKGIITFNYKGRIKDTITIGNPSLSSPISPYDYGVNDVWYDNGYGSANPLTEKPYSKLVNDTKAIGVSIIRYPGGNPSDTFHWEDAVGPQASRPPTLINSGAPRDARAVLPSKFGPEEFNNLLTDTNSAGDITVNFGTGTASEAADWVCYETAPYPDTANPGCDKYAKMRVDEGHPKPLNIPYWEVGNEPYVKTYWRSGQLISSPGNCANGDVQCLYVYGGTTRFNNQSITPLQSQRRRNNGLGSPQYYIPYPPVEASSLKLSVKGQTWRQVNNSTLDHSDPKDHVFSLNSTTGQLSFPDSKKIHHDSILASYISGPHQGFIDFYQAMKAANPSIHVCESYPSNYVLWMLGTTHPYDCYVLHDYGLIGGDDNHGFSAQQFHDQAILDSQSFASQISSTESTIAQYDGANAANVQIIMSEYGIINYQHPADADLEPTGIFRDNTAYHSSLDLGLYVANMLRVIVQSHISEAAKHYLVGYDLSLIPGVHDGNDTYDFSSNSMISTQYPRCHKGKCSSPAYILQPSAYVFEEFTKLLYKNLISSNVQNDPSVVISHLPHKYPFAMTGSYPKLSTLATTDDQGHEALMVINNSMNNVPAVVVPPNSGNHSFNAWTVGGNYLAYNTLANPNLVHLRHVYHSYSGSVVRAVFPPTSVTVIRF